MLEERPAVTATDLTSPARVAKALAAVLGMDDVDVNDDFFALGANSLDAGRLCVLLSADFGEVVSFAQVYRTPTATGLASWLDTLADRPASSAIGSDGPIPLTQGQANLVQAGDQVICVLAWWITGTLDIRALAAALTDVHVRHESLHCHYRRDIPPTALVTADPGEAEFRVLPAEDDDDAATRALYQAIEAPLDISQGRVWRAGLVPGPGADRALLGLGIHHVAFDGWSQVLLVGDLSIAYRARLAGHRPQWPAPAPSLAAVAEEERRQLDSANLDRLRAYWRDTLRSLTRLNIPGAARGPMAAAGPKEGRTVRIPAQWLSSWDTYARARRITPFGYFAAIFAEVLRRLTGQRNVAMMVPVAARGGTLLNATIASRLDAVCLNLPGGRGDPQDPLIRTGQVIEDAFAAQDLPFSEVVAALAQVRPDVHILYSLPIFVLQDNAATALVLPRCALVAVASPVAREAPNGLTVEVYRDPQHVTVRITVRTDLVPVEVADTIADDFAEILAAGPDAFVAADTGRAE